MPSQVFISYSRPDDERFGKKAPGWVTNFADNLRKLLRQQPGGREFEVWMDHHLQPQQSLTRALAQQLNDASALLAMLSPGYLDSDWCRGELAHFLGRFGGRTDDRVFLAEYLPIARERLHEAVQGLVPVAFWEKSIDKAAPMTLGFPTPDESDRLYWDLLRELAYALGERLGQDKASGAGARTPTKVWIATPTDDLHDRTVELAGFLRQLGCKVLDTKDAIYTKRGADAEADVNAALAAGVDLMLQCFGPLPGRVFGDLNESASALQWRVARAVAAVSGKPFLTWRAPDLQLDAIADPVYRDVLKGGLACGFEEFKRQIEQMVKGPAVEVAAPLASRGTGPSGTARAQLGRLQDQSVAPLICVSADAVDRALGQDVLGLLGALGADAMLAPEPSPDLPPDQWRGHYEQTLVDSDGLLIVYGSSKPSWVQGRLAVSRKMIAACGALTWPGLVDAPPPAKPPLGVQLRNLSLLDCRAGLSPAPLKEFLQQVRSSGTAGAVGV